MGVPTVGCHCIVCKSGLEKNLRMRPSVLLEMNGKKILIDVGPDFRDQAIKFGIDDIDGVIFTHTHYDHSGGVDDLRPIFFKKRSIDPTFQIPCLIARSGFLDLKARYHYLMHPLEEIDTDTKQFKFQLIEPGDKKATFCGIDISLIEYIQVGMGVNGLRFGNLAYVTDIFEYSEAVYPPLEGIEHLVISACKPNTSKVHITVDEALAFAARTRAKHVWLTHLSHSFDYEIDNPLLPPFAQLCYDGLTIYF